MRVTHVLTWTCKATSQQRISLASRGRIARVPPMVGPPTNGALRLEPLRYFENVVARLPGDAEGCFTEKKSKKSDDFMGGSRSENEALPRVNYLRNPTRGQRKTLLTEKNFLPAVNSIDKNKTSNGQPAKFFNTYRKSHEKASKSPSVSLSTTSSLSRKLRNPKKLTTFSTQTQQEPDKVDENLVRELVNSSIRIALTQIELESAAREVEVLEDLLNQQRVQIQENDLWAEKILYKMKALEGMIREATEMKEMRAVVQETCQQVTTNSLANVCLLDGQPKRSIGMGTRSVGNTRRQLQLFASELENDFFPWIFRQAEILYMKRKNRGHTQLFKELSRKKGVIFPPNS
ncbi:unnamed protein product [Caenorhabditis auriculariae]|uniref:Uncharacterized protein n=1 Tax=Caenorhabditis auriculariae TaxID=2777116 RepID=A0A8S1GMH5_9PELO|nr:unnamed protein product [Caenorhabditis auriculariae]